MIWFLSLPTAVTLNKVFLAYLAEKLFCALIFITHCRLLRDTVILNPNGKGWLHTLTTLNEE